MLGGKRRERERDLLWIVVYAEQWRLVVEDLIPFHHGALVV